MFVSPEVPVNVLGDAGRLRQVCVNLIGNAVKFTSAGEISVRVTSGPVVDGVAEVSFRFSDTGIGIEPAMLDKLCSPFVQADASITRRFGGTGLGLSISRHLVDLMGGSFRIESEPGSGTVISFDLPLQVGTGSTVDRKGGAASLAGRKVLVIDDRETNREITSAYLSAAGACVVAGDSVAEGISLLKCAAEDGSPIEAAVVDILMPGESGIDFLKAVSREPRLSGVKSIMTTSMSWSGDVGEVRKLGASALLSKPVNERELVSAVSRAIGVVAEERPREKRAEPGQIPAPARKSLDCCLLLVEDSLVNIEVASEYLNGLGCTITTATTGREALAACERRGFDIILMDCQMPDMDGLTATRHLREREERLALTRTPIIAVTANAYEEDRQRCLAAGMDDFLSKPFVEDDLVAVLERWLYKWSAPIAPAPVIAQEAESKPVALPVVAQQTTARDGGAGTPAKSKRKRAGGAGSPPRKAEADRKTRSRGRRSAVEIAEADRQEVAPEPAPAVRRIEHAEQLIAVMKLAAGKPDLAALKLAATTLSTASAGAGADWLAKAAARIAGACERGDVETCNHLVSEIELIAATEIELGEGDAVRPGRATG